MTKERLDGIMAIFAYVVLLGFVGILFGHVPRWDLGIIVAITLVLAGWDFWSMATGRKSDHH